MNKERAVNSVLIKLGLLAGVVILGLVATSIYQETKQKKQKQEIINALIEEKDRISRDNSVMQEKLTYYASKEYAEKKSKELNMQNPDEHLIVVRPNIVKENSVEQAVVAKKIETMTKVSNYKKWWSYLFEY